MVYKADDSAIKDARDDLDDAIETLKEDEIQDKIDAIDDEIDKLDDQIDSIDDQIDSITDSFEEQTDALEDYLNVWQKAVDNIELSENMAILEEYFGKDGTITGILNGSIKPSDGWTSDYMQTLKDISTVAGDGTLSKAATDLAALFGLDPSSFVSEFSNIAGTATTNQEAIDALYAAIAGGATTAASGEETASDGLTPALANAGAVGTTAVQSMSDAINDIAIKAINDETDAMNNFNEVAGQDVHKTVTIEYSYSGSAGNGTATGSASSHGKAAAGGGAISSNLEALVGEEGMELVAHRDGTYETVGENGAEFTNLKRGDLVFDASQTKDLLEKGKIPTRGKAFASGNATFTPLSDADPEKYNMLTKIANTLTGTNGLTNMISNLNSSIKDMLSNINTSTNTTPNISFGDINVSCTGVTSQEVVQTISDTLEKSFSGLALSAYQRSKTSK